MRGYIRLLLKAFNVPFQLPAGINIEVIELYADMKEVLRKAFGVYNSGAGLDRGSTFAV